MDKFLSSRPIRALLAALVVAFAGFALAACSGGGEEHGGEIEVVVEGEPVNVDPFQYNVLFTRPLNRFDVEDREYLVGQPPPEPGQTYIGVFVKVKNIDDSPHAIPEVFEIVDTADGRYESIESDSIYALPKGAMLGPDDVQPEIDSTAQVGPIQASMLLFKVEDAVLELRPVELELEGEEERAAVELDL